MVNVQTGPILNMLVFSADMLCYGRLQITAAGCETVPISFHYNQDYWFDALLVMSMGGRRASELV